MSLRESSLEIPARPNQLKWLVNIDVQDFHQGFQKALLTATVKRMVRALSLLQGTKNLEVPKDKQEERQILTYDYKK